MPGSVRGVKTSSSQLTDGILDFMKEHMKATKAENPGLPQSQLLRILAEKWRRSKEGGVVEDLVAGMGRLAM